MKTITTRATVTSDGTLTAKLPPDVPPGEHRVTVVIDDQPGATPQRDPLELPVHDFGPWPEELSLRREDLYGDDGR